MICQKDFSQCRTPGTCAPHGGCAPLNSRDAQSAELIGRLMAENEALRKALTTIREESHDIGACECAADALIDSRKVNS